jgi:hypothetical protein
VIREDELAILDETKETLAARLDTTLFRTG